MVYELELLDAAGRVDKRYYDAISGEPLGNPWRIGALRLLLVEDDSELAAGIAADLRHGALLSTPCRTVSTRGIPGPRAALRCDHPRSWPSGKPGLEVLKAWRDAGLLTPCADPHRPRRVEFRNGSWVCVRVRTITWESLSTTRNCRAWLQSLLRRSTGRASA